MKASVSLVVVSLLASAAASAGVTGVDRGPELLVIGPVETVDLANRSATILGQHVHTTAVLAVGDSVAVFGLANRDGSIEAVSVQPRGLYIPGASAIFINGVVQQAQSALGRVVLNGLTVDLTAAMSHGTVAPALGSKLAIYGTQPVSRGLVLVNGIAGTGADVNGIAGTGSGVSGIAGTGSSVSGIAGTGASVSGIAGTGARVSGIAGTGAGVSGIAGTGSSVSGIAGTGARVSGIAGTGSNVSGIAGTGSQLQ